jgi:hypothetical protein
MEKNICYYPRAGEVAERSNAAVLKTVEGIPLPGFESLPLRFSTQSRIIFSLLVFSRDELESFCFLQWKGAYPRLLKFLQYF